MRHEIIPTLRYADAPRAIAFLCDAFGFEHHAVYADDIDPALIHHAQLVLADRMVMLATATDTDYARASGQTTAANVGGVTMGLYIIVADVDAHADRARAAGADIFMPPCDQDYGVAAIRRAIPKEMCGASAVTIRGQTATERFARAPRSATGEMVKLTSPQPLRIALAGLGTVGGGVMRLLDANRDLIARRAGREIEIVAISARDRARDRGVNLSRFAWIDDTTSLAQHDATDVVVELIGGSDGPALTLARNTLAAGKSLVTANKAMLAHHGLELARAAEEVGVALKFEAAVAGGVPVVKGLREGAAANALSRVYGILNGTCNFILSRMESEGRDFADVLAEAQALGFAEADPGFDIDGVDAAHKLALLASLAFGTRPAFNAVAASGIRHLLAADIAEAAALGYRVRLLGLAEDGPDGLFQRVHPHLVPIDHPLAHVTGPTNAVVAEGNFVGRLLFQGAGAGDGPTASAVVADLIDIARGEFGPAFSMPATALAGHHRAETGERVARVYLRFTVADRVGVLAEIAAAMRDAGVSIESLIQRGVSADGSVLVAIVTHEAPERAVAQAIERLRGSQSLTGQPLWMPILA